jgi:acetyl-CoA/propionyl-CoA carboxylase biotin carboxyl carrier protein
MVVGRDYDPMLSKVIAWAPDRRAALRVLDSALSSTVILGVTTNLGFLRDLLADRDVVSGRLDTGLVERILKGGTAPAGAPDEAFATAALVLHPRSDPGGDPWDIADGWRIGERGWTSYRLESRGRIATVRVRGLPEDAEIDVDGHPIGPARLIPARHHGPARPHDSAHSNVPARPDVLACADIAEQPGPRAVGRDVLVTVGGTTRRHVVARHRETVWLSRDGRTWAIIRHDPGDPGDRGGGSRTTDGVIRSPMPGTVLAVKVVVGERVHVGQPLLIVEAMKMEHTVTAPMDGIVAELPVTAGRSVDMDAVLAVITAEVAESAKASTSAVGGDRPGADAVPRLGADEAGYAGDAGTVS